MHPVSEGNKGWRAAVKEILSNGSLTIQESARYIWDQVDLRDVITSIVWIIWY